MGDHRVNPQSVAKQNGQQMIRLSDLGDGVGFAGFEVGPVGLAPGPCDCGTASIGITAEHVADRVECPQNAPPMLAAGLFAVGGPHSPLSVRVDLRRVFIGEIGRIPVEALKRLLSATPEEPKPEGVTPGS